VACYDCPVISEQGAKFIAQLKEHANNTHVSTFLDYVCAQPGASVELSDLGRDYFDVSRLNYGQVAIELHVFPKYGIYGVGVDFKGWMFKMFYCVVNGWDFFNSKRSVAQLIQNVEWVATHPGGGKRFYRNCEVHKGLVECRSKPQQHTKKRPAGVRRGRLS
jgi:hypothetical protein